jgi:hypothetical protein
VLNGKYAEMALKFSKKRIAAVVAIGLLAAVGGAVAYFSGASNSATGSGSVGASTQFAVSQGSPTWSGSLTALYPGASNDTEYLPFTATNNGNGKQAVTNVTVSIPQKANGDAQTAAGVDITGCQASWFTATVDATNPTLPADIAAGGTYTGKIDLTMQDSGTNQNSCQGAAPAVTVTVS